MKHTPDIAGDTSVKWYPFLEVVTDVTAKFHKVKASEYQAKGKFKIIDQGKQAVASYTDNEELINTDEIPVIIFGDHTRVFKYEDTPIALGADGAKALKVDSQLANTLYIYHYLRSIKLPNAGYSRHFKFLKKIKIPIPQKNGEMDFEAQIHIVHLLSKVEELITKRKRHQQQLNDLLNGVFLDMFGDIKARKSKHPWEKLRPYLSASSGKSSKAVSTDTQTQFPIYGGNGINGWAKMPLYEESVVIAGRVGQQCGVIHVSNGPCWVTDNAIVITTKPASPRKLNTAYLSAAFQNAPIREKVKQLDLPFINQRMLLDFPLPLPPIELQDEFAVVVDKIERIKTQYQKSLNWFESFYGVLSQEAFKGVLDLSKMTLSPLIRENVDNNRLKKHSLTDLAKKPLLDENIRNPKNSKGLVSSSISNVVINEAKKLTSVIDSNVVAKSIYHQELGQVARQVEQLKLMGSLTDNPTLRAVEKIQSLTAIGQSQKHIRLSGLGDVTKQLTTLTQTLPTIDLGHSFSKSIADLTSPYTSVLDHFKDFTSQDWETIGVEWAFNDYLDEMDDVFTIEKCAAFVEDELHNDEAEEPFKLSHQHYEQIKKMLFNAFENRYLIQKYDDGENAVRVIRNKSSDT